MGWRCMALSTSAGMCVGPGEWRKRSPGMRIGLLLFIQIGTLSWRNGNLACGGGARFSRWIRVWPGSRAVCRRCNSTKPALQSVGRRRNILWARCSAALNQLAFVDVRTLVSLLLVARALIAVLLNLL